MTVKKALEEVRKSPFYSEKEEPYLVSCVDFGEFWGLGFSAEPQEKGGVCFGYYSVPKSGGKIDFFNPADNLSLLDTAKEIPLDEVLT